MKRFIVKNNNYKNTMNKMIFIVFFCVLLTSLLLVNSYGNKTSEKAITLVNEKIDKIIYTFFSDLITNDVINKKSVNNILIVSKNSKGEIITVDYDLEKTYKILTIVSNILKDGINDLENGKIDVKLYDKYLESNKNGLVLYIPFLLASNNIFVHNLGPKLPVLVSFNENLLTNIKTKVTNYGFNNALLEIYITVEMQKLIISPISKDEKKFSYDILIGAVVVNGSVPNFYGGKYENTSNILDIPIK